MAERALTLTVETCDRCVEDVKAEVRDLVDFGPRGSEAQIGMDVERMRHGKLTFHAAIRSVRVKKERR